MPTSARFTPSLLDEATLEALFVGRHHFIDDCVARVHKAATSSARSAKLFVGPRGAGKTHLLSLVNYRCRHLAEFGKSFQIAWLPEDLWTIDSLESLLKEIVRALEPVPAVSDSGQNETPLEILRRAASIAGPIVVLIENIDQVFEAMGDSGQRELRALIENTGSLLLIATSTRSTESLTNQSSPFYGFFDTTELERFSVEDAAVMLKRIADQQGNVELSAFLDTPRARQRLAAISHLAGGQPRVWSLLASGLTVEGLDDLVGVLMERFDDLTPYYQEQMARLSMNERKTIRALSDLDHSCTVKDLAAATGIDQRSISKTISDLRLQGWVCQRTGPIVDMADGRHSYYDLAEPLARLAFQLKESRGKPIRLIVDFLKLWFDEGAPIGRRSNSLVVTPYMVAVRDRESSAPTSQLISLLNDEIFLKSFFLTPNVLEPKRLSHLLSRIDDGFESLGKGNASDLLALPAGLVGLIEDGLVHGESIESSRLSLVKVAVGFTDPKPWIKAVESYFGVLVGDQLKEANAMLSLLYAQNRQLDLAETMLIAFSKSASPNEIIRFALRHVQFGQPLLALQALECEPLKNANPAERVLTLLVRNRALRRLQRRSEASSVNRELDDLIRTELGFQELTPFHVRRYLEDSLVSF